MDDTNFSADEEEIRLLRIAEDCKAKVTAARHALSYPTRSMLMQEVWKLEKDLKLERAECEKATAALREYREHRRSQVAENSK